MAEMNDDKFTYYGVPGEAPQFRAGQDRFSVSEFVEGEWVPTHSVALAACVLTNQVVKVDAYGNFTPPEKKNQ